MQVYKHRVRFNEVDAQGVVFNAHYLTWCDHAVYEFFRQKGWSPIQLKSMNVDLAVRIANIDFSAPGYLDQLLSFEINIKKVGTTSFTAEFLITEQDSFLATATITYVNVINSEVKPLPLFIKEYLNSIKRENPIT